MELLIASEDTQLQARDGGADRLDEHAEQTMFLLVAFTQNPQPADTPGNLLQEPGPSPATASKKCVTVVVDRIFLGVASTQSTHFSSCTLGTREYSVEPFQLLAPLGTRKLLLSSSWQQFLGQTCIPSICQSFIDNRPASGVDTTAISERNAVEADRPQQITGFYRREARRTLPSSPDSSVLPVHSP